MQLYILLGIAILMYNVFFSFMNILLNFTNYSVSLQIVDNYLINYD